VNRGKLKAARAEVERLRASRFVMLDLIQEFIDMDGQDCSADQSIECAPHGYPTIEADAPCPYTQARELLKAHEKELAERKRSRSQAAISDLMAALDRIEGGTS
jgi:hypothetical protein